MVKMLWKTMATRNNSSRLQLTRTFWFDIQRIW
jgi:hypothetical protein